MKRNAASPASGPTTPTKRPRLISATDGCLRIGVLALQGAFKEHAQMLERAGASASVSSSSSSSASSSSSSVSSSSAASIDTTPRVIAREVRTVQQLAGLDGLVLPGGESTAIAKIATRFGSAASGGEDDMLGALRRWVADDARRPVWGTCAGLIFLADRIVDGAKIGGQSVIGGLDVGVSRNFFGKQISSFEAYIRAPPSTNAAASSPKSMLTTEEGGEDVDEEEYLGVFIRAPAVLDTGKNVNVLATIPSDKVESGSVAVAVEQDHLLATAFHPELTEDLRWHKYFVEKCLQAKNRTAMEGVGSSSN